MVSLTIIVKILRDYRISLQIHIKEGPAFNAIIMSDLNRLLV